MSVPSQYVIPEARSEHINVLQKRQTTPFHLKSLKTKKTKFEVYVLIIITGLIYW